ncbi:exodeoxyribonuclease V subunit alpha [Silvimonas iriomotensis]|uniref:RecBCD enzyme subunit RecD n=1 Tax=Silvimonas iriomotensis TaxID=449662 RepID=A0ABQ2P7Y8_9NEIS|nr:exodeoxyribonuclease V subunit alpha [Silvimonas iriomotensis]GGP20339.1 RecBCD enzyme subunit RecD [Silvimonas iriomotensis]
MIRRIDTLSGDLFADAAPLVLDRVALFEHLNHWTSQHWLRQLDTAFARFLADLDPQASPAVLLAATLLAHMEGRGHSCLMLDELAHDPATLLAWPVAGLNAWQSIAPAMPGHAAGWQAELGRSTVVTTDPATSNAPLVLAGTRLYLRRYHGYEQSVANAVRQRTAHAQGEHDALVRQWLDRLFEHDPANQPDWQKMACAIGTRGQLAVVTGGPGTGKTYTVARLLALLLATADHPDTLRVALAAPTGKAAARLKQSIDGALQDLQQKVGADLALTAFAERVGAARTLHSLLGARPDTRKFRHHAGNPLEVDVLIVDEASMIHLEMMAALLDALPAHARLILLGDKDQLASVEAGAVLGDLCRDAEAGRYTGATVDFVSRTTGQTLPAQYLGQGNALAQQTVMLRVSRRFGGPIGQLALAVNRGDAPAALAVLMDHHAAVQWRNRANPQAVVELALSGRAGAPGGYASYLEVVKQRPPDVPEHESWVRAVLGAFERFRVLCAVREGDWGVAGLNKAIETELARHDWLPRNRGEWYTGRPVMITRNDPGMKVYNGDIGIALPDPATDALRVYFLDGQDIRSVLASRLADVETAFAMTVHKSQGSEFEHTVLALPVDAGQILTRELVYTGITRARQYFTLVSASQQGFEDALGRQTRRASGLYEGLAGA